MRYLNYYCYVSFLISLTLIRHTNANVDPIEGRYSFSLTTFHPNGKLPQLDHAIKASTIGPPIIALSLPNSKGILLTSIQSLPSPLICDDGTSRFVRISKSIMMGHTGVNADGRIACEAAQRLSVEHTYTFNEEIPIDVLLEEMALLFQQYTMKPGCRPFGCSLVFASCDINDDGGENGEFSLFRIDPAGTVTKLDSIQLLGRGNNDEITRKLIDAGCLESTSIDEAEKRLLKVLREDIGIGEKNGNDGDSKVTNNIPPYLSFLCAKCLGPNNMKINRNKL